MNRKVLLVAIIRLFLKNRVPYEASLSMTVLLILIGNELIRMLEASDSARSGDD